MLLSRLAAPALVVSSLCFLLSGCGVVGGTPSASTFAAAEIRGNVHGGQQPIVGARVYLYAAGSSGYGTGAMSLLAGPGFTLTGLDGSFTLNGLYSLSACQAAHQQVYLIAAGGNPGAGINESSVLMAALGDCGNLTSSTFTWINEVTTVASAYALQQFMTPGTVNVGTSSTNLTGLANAFLTVPNLASLSNGNALAVPPAGNGTVPQGELYYLANILAACVNSTSGSAQCNGLFAAATPPGGTAPTDTLAAILDIALNPGHNVAALYMLPPPVVAFPTSFAQPSDWTVAVKYTGGGMLGPVFPAIDASGNIWISNNSSTAVSEFSPAGVSLQGPSGLATTFTHEGTSIDIYGNVWVSGLSRNNVTQISNSNYVGVPYDWDCGGFGLTSSPSGYTWSTALNGVACLAEFLPTDITLGNGTGSGQIAFDAAGHLWVPSQNARGREVDTVTETTNTGSLLPGEPANGWSDPLSYNVYLPVIDAQGNAWLANGNGLPQVQVVTVVSAAGQVLSGNGFPDCGPSGTGAIDGANTLWLQDGDTTVCHLSHSGALLSPPSGYKVSGLNGSGTMAIDASGNLWSTDSSTSQLVERVGLAAPVMTPLVQNLVHNTIGQRP